MAKESRRMRPASVLSEEIKIERSIKKPMKQQDKKKWRKSGFFINGRVSGVLEKACPKWEQKRHNEKNDRRKYPIRYSRDTEYVHALNEKREIELFSRKYPKSDYLVV